MMSARWMLMFNGCNRQSVLFTVCLIASLASFHAAANDPSQQQRDDVGESTRDRREAVSFWKRLGTLAPDARDKLAAFWKRGHPHDALDSFWKRGVPAAGRRVQAFWKRFVELADNDEDLAAMLAEMRAAGGPAHAAEKKHFFAGRQQQQRRAKETSARRPEFNPTGW